MLRQAEVLTGAARGTLGIAAAGFAAPGGLKLRQRKPSPLQVIS
jgi:hypothetical protein